MKHSKDKIRMDWIGIYGNTRLICNWGPGDIQFRAVAGERVISPHYPSLRKAIDAAMKYHAKRRKGGAK